MFIDNTFCTYDCPMNTFVEGKRGHLYGRVIQTSKKNEEV